MKVYVRNDRMYYVDKRKNRYEVITKEDGFKAVRFKDLPDGIKDKELKEEI